MSTAKQVTIVVVPRERFSHALISLRSVLADAGTPFELVYVDAGSPPDVRGALAAEAATHRFRLVRTDEYLTPNEARNLGAAHAQTRYVLFIDNDAVVEPGFAARLVACAEETGADAVTPLYFIDIGGEVRIHSAGGTAHVTEHDGVRRFHERHDHDRETLAEAEPTLRRQATEMTEFHAVLVRRAALDRIGPCDPHLLSALEHLDFSLAVRETGGTIWFEPSARLTYVTGTRFRGSDLPYYFLRWSEAWNDASLRHFAAKHRLELDDPFLVFQRVWLRRKRRFPLARIGASIERTLGATARRKIEGTLDRVIAPPLIRLALRHRRAGVADATPLAPIPSASSPPDANVHEPARRTATGA